MALFSRTVARKQNKDSRAIETLARALADPDPYTRENAVKSLGLTRDPAAVPALVRALADREEVVRCRAAEALGEIGSPVAVEALMTACADPKALVRQSTLAALAKRRDQRSLAAFQKALNDEASAVRREAVRGLAFLDKDLGRRACLAALSDDSSDVRLVAARELQNLGWSPGSEDEAIRALIALKDWAGLRSHGRRAAAALRDVVRRETEAAYEWKVSGKIGKEGMEACFPRLVCSPDANALVDALAALGGAAAVEALVRIWVVGNDRPYVETAVQRAADEQSVDVLVRERLENTVLAERERIVANGYSGLDQVGTRAFISVALKRFAAQALPHLVQASRSRVVKVRENAAAALGELGEKGAVGSLISALGDESPGVRAAAAGALGRLGDERAVEPLASALLKSGEDDPERAVASKALASLGDARALLPLCEKGGWIDIETLLEKCAPKAATPELVRAAEVLSERAAARRFSEDEVVFKDAEYVAGLRSIDLIETELKRRRFA